MIQPQFIMLVGLPCSGKSTYAKNIATDCCATIFSSDALREELFGDVNEQSQNHKLFVELHKRIKAYLKVGVSCIYDATNMSSKRRRAFLRELNNIPCTKHCVIIATPYQECLKRNSKRARKIPEEVIKRMYMNFEIPWYFEGWDEIKVEYSEGSKDSFGGARAWVKDVMEFNQDNPHHTMTLGKHCLTVSEQIFEQDASIRSNNLCALKCAGLLHDEGKIFTKTFIDSKGNPSKTAHYYSHHNVSSYNSLFYEFPANHLYVATLIQWHMQMHFNKEQKTIDKWRKLWGEQLYKDLCILHQADLAAH